jgi:hypothetical protein
VNWLGIIIIFLIYKGLIICLVAELELGFVQCRCSNC